VGFLPAEKPKLTIFVMIDEPQRKYLGSGTAAPVFKKIAEHAMHLFPGQFPIELPPQNLKKSAVETVFKALSIPAAADPEEQKKPKQIIKRLKNKTFRDVLLIAARENITVDISGSGKARYITRDPARKNHYQVKLR